MTLLDEYLKHILIFIILVLSLLGWHAYESYHQYIDFHQKLSERSVKTSAAAIKTMLAIKKQMIRLFAGQEKELLFRLISNPHDVNLRDKLKQETTDTFPDHLNFLLADGLGENLYTEYKNYVGERCLAQLHEFAMDSENKLPLMLHPNKKSRLSHFDVLTSVDVKGNKVGILFISFKLEELRAVLRRGEIFGHHLLLVHKDNPEEIALRANPDYLAGINVLTVPQQKRITATYSIDNSNWILVDITAKSVLYEEYKHILYHVIAMFFFVMGIYLLMLWVMKTEGKKTIKTRDLLQEVDNERRRIAMDMHDQVLSEFSHISRAANQIPDRCDTENEIPRLKASISNVTNNIRHIINDLHPHYLDNLGLESAIQDYLHKYCGNKDSPRWTVTADEGLDRRLSNDQRFNLYRIVLEVINNIIKHAKCDNFSISLDIDYHVLLLKIEDDGIGFDPAKPNPGMGLTNIETRSKLINAATRWQKPKNHRGTIFTLSLKLAL